MEYVNNIYPCTHIRIMTFYTTRIMSYVYACILELRLTLASIPCFSNNIVYDFV